jgi:hypothetical protein
MDKNRLKKLNTIFLALTFGILYCSNNAQAVDEHKISWASNKSAVAWRTEKKMFLFKSEAPVGINSEIKTSVSRDGGVRTVKVIIPIAKFNSGEPDRDKDVIAVLKGDIQPELEYTSARIDEETWQGLLSGKIKSLGGSLKLGNELFPLEFTISTSGTGTDQLIEGVTETKFSYLKVPAPSVGGGVVAKVKDELSLHLHIYAKDIQGF